MKDRHLNIMDWRPLRRARRGVEWLFYFTRFAVRQFFQQKGLQIASSLAYATLLALVPLITVMFSVLGGLPVFENVGDRVQTYIFENFVPAFGDTVLDYISRFSDKASELTLTGSGMVFIIALMLLATIDDALNSIWHVQNRRGALSRFLVYWAILTMGPLLLGIGMFSTSYLMSLPLISEVDAGLSLEARFLSWLPFITTSIAFSALYILIPNCFVPRGYAVIGGVTAAILFELAKFGFGLYVRTMPGFETIYGALAIIPVFLIWIYTSWVVLLLGAHITFCLSVFRLSSEKTGRKYHDWSFEEVYQIIYLLWLAQKRGMPLTFNAIRRHGLRIPQHQINEIMGHLQDANWIQNAGNDHWILSRDMDAVTILDLHRIVPKPLPVVEEAERSPAHRLGLGHLLLKYEASLQENLAVPISKLLEQDHERQMARENSPLTG